MSNPARKLWPPEDFVDRILVKGLDAKHVVVGENFTFGYRAAGTVDVLRVLGRERGFTVSKGGVTVLGKGQVIEPPAVTSKAEPTEPVESDEVAKA